jgi:thiol-disulfide isomerase/thioredoxin
MKSYIYGIVAVVITAAFLYLGWAKYEDFLYQGRRPPESVTQLLTIEQSGLPELTFTDLSGNQIELLSFKDRILIVNFWASWCEPCVKEFPSLMELVARYKGKLVLLAISGDYEKDDIDAFLKAFSVSSPNVIVAWDKDQAIAKRFGTFKLPESFIFAKGGEFIRKIVGVDDWATPEAFSFFDDLVKK